MDWKELKIYTAHENMEDLSAALISAGVTGLVVNDPEDIKAFAAEKSASWDYIDDELLKSAASGEPFTTVYISDDPDGAHLSESISFALDRIKSLGIGFRIESGSIREEDWANEWKKYFKPLNVGEKLIIKPSWEEIPDPHGRKIIELDPETSFGTGRHYTTQLALELLEKNLNPGDSVLDLGCGSGIIFISALALGASGAVGVDISPDAKKISAKNARQNGFSDEKFSVCCGDVITDDNLFKEICKGYDLVAANIVADVLLGMKDLFHKLLKPDGTLILSGIIDGRTEEVLNAVKANGFTVIEQKHRDIWNAAALRSEDLR